MTMLGTRLAPTGLATLAAALVAGGCGSSPDDAPSQRASTVATTEAAPARTSTTPRSRSSHRPRSPTATATTPQPAKPKAQSPSAPTTSTTRAPAQRSPAARTKLGKPQIFRGEGDRVIGTLTLKRDAVVRWTVAGGGEFSVRDGGGGLRISGSGRTGQSFAASGDHRSVKVTASGRWTLSFASLGA